MLACIKKGIKFSNLLKTLAGWIKLAKINLAWNLALICYNHQGVLVAIDLLLYNTARCMRNAVRLYCHRLQLITGVLCD